MFLYGLNPSWLLLMGVSLILGFVTQGYINSTYRRWSRVSNPSGLTGAEVAERILQANGVGGATVSGGAGSASAVRIRPTTGSLTDNYDPRDKSLNLSEGVYGSTSVAAAGVAAHEAGHAVQDAQGYVWNRVRGFLVPAASFGSRAGWILIVIGLILGVATGFGQLAVRLGILFYMAAVAFTLVTLPVELDASRRALASLDSTGTLAGESLAGAKQVLTAAAFTYVAAALIAIMQLLYLIGISRRN